MGIKETNLFIEDNITVDMFYDQNEGDWIMPYIMKYLGYTGRIRRVYERTYPVKNEPINSIRNKWKVIGANNEEIKDITEKEIEEFIEFKAGIDIESQQYRTAYHTLEQELAEWRYKEFMSIPEHKRVSIREWLEIANLTGISDYMSLYWRHGDIYLRFIGDIPNIIDNIPPVDYIDDGAVACVRDRRKLQHINLDVPTLKGIGYNAFNECINLREVILGSNIKNIENKAFRKCSNLVNINMHNIEKIGPGAFSYCDKIEIIELPKKLVKVEHGTFYYCRGLKQVIIPENVKDIEKTAFYGCKQLTDVNIPDTVEHIHKNAFYGAPWRQIKENKEFIAKRIKED